MVNGEFETTPLTTHKTESWFMRPLTILCNLSHRLNSIYGNPYSMLQHEIANSYKYLFFYYNSFVSCKLFLQNY
jgi:hypothetical protein